MTSLTAREREIIRLRFGIDRARQYTYDQMADIFGITRERIRQIEKRALEKLEDILTGKLFPKKEKLHNDTGT